MSAVFDFKDIGQRLDRLVDVAAEPMSDEMNELRAAAMRDEMRAIAEIIEAIPPSKTPFQLEWAIITGVTRWNDPD